MSTKRLPPRIRMNEMTLAALALAVDHGYDRVTRDQVAAACSVSPSAVQYHFPTMTQLRRSVMRAAVRHGNLPVIAQGLAAKDPIARRAAPDVQQAAAEGMLR